MDDRYVNNHRDEQNDEEGKMELVPELEQAVIGNEGRNAPYLVKVVADKETDRLLELVLVLGDNVGHACLIREG